MSGEHDKEAAPEVIYGPETRPSWGTPTPPPKLGPLPAHIDVGSVPIDSERTFLVAAPFMLNHGRGELHTSIEPRVANRNTPSAFRDEIGLDPDPVMDGAAVEAFHLASPAKHQVTGYGAPPPLRVRFRPSRPGPFEVVVRVSVVADDGTMDEKTIRVTGVGTQGKQAPKPIEDRPAAPKIVDNVNVPNMDKTLEGAIVHRPYHEVRDTGDFASAVEKAKDAADRLLASQANGVTLAASDIVSYQKMPVPPSMFDEIIEIAFMMGVSGIAGIVAKYVTENLAKMIPKGGPSVTPTAPSPPTTAPAPAQGGQTTSPSPVTTTPTPAQEGQTPTSASARETTKSPFVAAMEHSIRDGFKNAAKNARKSLAGSQKSGEQLPGGVFSSNALNDFLADHRNQLLQDGAVYEDVAIEVSEMVGQAEPSQGRAAMITLARGMASASAVADQVQAHAIRLAWVAAVAREANGVAKAKLPDGSSAETTNLDEARSYGAETWYSESGVSKHDGVLDIHVELPVGMTPVETSGFKVKSASITGVSQEVADRLFNLHLAHAGIPIRLVVSGHPALITRDELGRVRINGYLLTKDAGNGDGPPTWTEAHMHRGATLLVDKVLSKTLKAWGIDVPRTDDATGRGNVAK